VFSMNDQANKQNIILRIPNDQDINAIYELLSFYAQKELLLSLSKKDISERLPTFLVACDKSKLIACAAVRDFGDNLYEIRSLAVSPDYTGQKIGSRLVKNIIKTIDTNPSTKIFALTYRATFFENLGFKHVNKELFPQKIWSDCTKCPKQNNCDEEALMLTF